MHRAIGAALIALLCAVAAAHAEDAYGIDHFAGDGKMVSHARHVDSNGTRILIGGRPAGCPHAYCGCGLARYLGKSDKRLNLAWNWARLFPRVSARSGAAAVRHHHVMLLERHVSGTRWIVRDFNGGRHLSWIHERDVRGYVFVDPSSTRVAMQ